MSRNFRTGLLVIAIVGLIYVVAYRAPSPLMWSAQTVEFGGVSLRIEYATTTAERELGLSGRINVPDDYGMLFVFPVDDYYGFWMKDTLVPLDMFWLDAQGQVVYIAKDVATSSYPNVFYPTEPARYVLETTAGFARAHDITVGTPLLLKNFPIVTE
ncbi:MAG: DUF192 domain-containing protein [Candidatus Gottesmanbacteria bacterium]|nr:DUF192 domain-containing protein [Candidatus Gottesmanbacteria bacterium]